SQDRSSSAHGQHSGSGGPPPRIRTDRGNSSGRATRRGQTWRARSGWHEASTPRPVRPEREQRTRRKPAAAWIHPAGSRSGTRACAPLSPGGDGTGGAPWRAPRESAAHGSPASPTASVSTRRRGHAEDGTATEATREPPRSRCGPTGLHGIDPSGTEARWRPPPPPTRRLRPHSGGLAVPPRGTSPFLLLFLSNRLDD